MTIANFQHIVLSVTTFIYILYVRMSDGEKEM